MTFNEVIYSIREGVRQYSDDSTLSNRLILFNVDLERASYLNYHANKGELPDTNKQTICLTLEETSNTECGCITEDCTIMRSTVIIPKMIDRGRVAIGAKDSIPIKVISWNKFVHSGNNKYNQDTIFAAVNPDGRLYLKSNNVLHKLLECAYLTATFENPKAAEDFSNEDGTVCFNASTDAYPIDMDGFNRIRKVVLKTLLMSLGVPEDLINNANDDIQGKAK